MYLIVVHDNKSLSVTKKSPTVIGETITNAFEFILPKVIDGVPLSEFNIIATLTDKNKGNPDFAFLEVGEIYNDNYVTGHIRESDCTVNYSTYNIWITFFNLKTSKVFTTESSVIQLVSNGEFDNIENEKKLIIISQIETMFNKKLAEFQAIKDDVERLANQIVSIANDVEEKYGGGV